MVNTFQAKTTLSKLLEQIEDGREQEIVIARHGRPVARLTRVAPGKSGQRIGVAKGKFTVPESIDGANDAVARLLQGKRP
jgi:antitoxin (DNA-binding transcriptional repressor) of toxin-antitoxin stability system